MKTSRLTTCHDIHGKLFKVPTDRLSFRPSVYGVIINGGKILLSRQWDGYDFPGGGINLGETIHQALCREVKEETGLNIRPGQLLAIEDSFFKLPVSKKYVHSILIYFLCQILGGKVSTKFASREEKTYLGKPEWISLSSVGSLKFYNSVDSASIIDKARKLQGRG